MTGAVVLAEESVLAAYGMADFPFGIAVVALFVIVLLRAQGTYWLGRGVAAGARTRPAVRRITEGPGVVRAIALLHRWGPLAVTLSFFTVGLQTVVNAAAGLVRMPWLRYTLFMVPGCVAWAFIYATIGLAAFLAIVSAAAGSPWGLAAVVLAVVAVGVLVVLRLRRPRPDDPRG
ncbi:DedA family protein [Salana multivorans]|uniref:DedA family protein n=1 Tax=Salana multivorans TaxID=120377 RepID=UPI000B15AD14|nr:VTT domain-containing protein [Salana multivorans]